MPRPLKDSRIGIYECTITNGLVSKDKPIRYDYKGVFTWDDLISNIIPDLRQNRRLQISQYPVLITSWRLQKGDLSKPKPGAQTTKTNGSLTVYALRRQVGIPLKRKKDPRSETWEAVVYETGRAVKIRGHKLMD